MDRLSVAEMIIALLGKQ